MAVTVVAPLISAVLLLALYSNCGAGSADKTVDIGTHSLPAVVAGGGLPVVIIDGGAGEAGYQQYWIIQSRALAVKSSRGQLIVAEDSSHRLHTEATDLVVQTVLSVLKEVERSRRGRAH